MFSDHTSDERRYCLSPRLTDTFLIMELRRIHSRSLALLIGLVVLVRVVSGCGSLDSQQGVLGASHMFANDPLNIEPATQNPVGTSIVPENC